MAKFVNGAGKKKITRGKMEIYCENVQLEAGKKIMNFPNLLQGKIMKITKIFNHGKYCEICQLVVGEKMWISLICQRKKLCKIHWSFVRKYLKMHQSVAGKNLKFCEFASDSAFKKLLIVSMSYINLFHDFIFHTVFWIGSSSLLLPQKEKFSEKYLNFLVGASCPRYFLGRDF